MVTAKSVATNYTTEIIGGAGKVISDVPAIKGGTGEGMRPFEMLLGGFAACFNITLRMLMDKKGIRYRSVEVSVSEDREIKPGTMQISYKANIDADIEEAEKQDLINKAFAKCPVHNALSGNIEFEEGIDISDNKF